MHEGCLVYRAEEQYHLTACGPALLKAVLARIKAAEEQLSTSRCTSLHQLITLCHVSQYLSTLMSCPSEVNRDKGFISTSHCGALQAMIARPLY